MNILQIMQLSADTSGGNAKSAASANASTASLSEFSRKHESTKEEMKRAGYSEEVIGKYVRIWGHFRNYAQEHEVSYYTEELMLAFFEEECGVLSKPKSTYRRQEMQRALNKLDEYNKYQRVSSRRPVTRKVYVFSGEIGISVKQYIEYRRSNVSKARLQSIQLYMERFCEYVNKNTSTGVEGLNAEIIQNFVASCNIYTVATVAGIAICLRGYLKYLYEQELTQKNLSTLVPHIFRRRDSEIPSAYAAEDIEKLLSVIDRSYSKGKRDYAMILIAARLGLRSSDICGLTFSSIDWERNTISLTQQKTEEQVSYPLLEDVGVAIIDYLKYGRKAALDKTYVFLSELPPYARLKNGSLYNIVDTYMKRANIHVPVGKKHGPHALRHSLSSRLLENDIPLSIISDILAHKSTETTKIYLKIAEKQLLECAIAVPALQAGCNHG